MRRRRTLKTVAEVVALVLVSPAVAAYHVLSLLSGPERAFPGFSQAVALLPGLTGTYLRRAFYRWSLAGCGEDSYIGFGALLTHPETRLGKGVYVGPYSVLGRVTLLDDVLLGSHVSVANGGRQHGTERLDVPMRDQPGEFAPVTLGPDCWVGDRAVILADVGAHAMIGAGAVVAKPIEPYAVAAGVPARTLRYRNAPTGHLAVEPTSLVGGVSR